MIVTPILKISQARNYLLKSKYTYLPDTVSIKSESKHTDTTHLSCRFPILLFVAFCIVAYIKNL